tara:strand:- start:1437 stop:2330 length:894 start_codon:yes stop_codon:yes gene_type:complete
VNNILFFGASGRLGKNWVKEIISNNKIYVNLNKKKIKLKNKNLFEKKFDINKPKQIISFCKNKKISLIINCIGLSNVDLSETNKSLAKKLNYIIPLKLSKIAKQINVLFVHISTDMLFKGNSKKKYKENSRYFPINNYSKTKIQAEKGILKYKKSLVIRTNFFGFSNKNKQTISDKILTEQRKKKQTYLWDDIYFTPVYQKVLFHFINLLIKSKSTGIYNISTDKCISKFNFGLKLVKKIIQKPKITPNNFDNDIFTRRPKNMCLSNDKLKKKFPKFKHMLTLEYQIKLFNRDFKSI